MWYRVAKEARTRRVEVLVSVFRHRPAHPKVQELEDRGCIVSTRSLPPYAEGISVFQRGLGELKMRLQSTFSFDMKPISDFSPDAVLISSGETFDYIFHSDTWLGKYMLTEKIPYFLISQLNWEHDIDVTDTFRLERRKTVSNAARCFFVSGRNLRIAERQLAMPINNACVINNPVDLDDCSYLPYPVDTTAQMACVARFHTFIKCQDLLLEVLAEPRWKNRDWQLNLYGAGRDLSHLRRLVKLYDLSDHVAFCGHVDNIREIWETNHILVLPSRAEGTPLALLEAMTLGRTAVVCDVGGNTHWLNNNGFVAAAPSYNCFNEVLEEAWNRRNEWEELGRRCHQYAHQHLELRVEHFLLEEIAKSIA